MSNYGSTFTSFWRDQFVGGGGKTGRFQHLKDPRFRGPESSLKMYNSPSLRWHGFSSFYHSKEKVPSMLGLKPLTDVLF